MLAINLIILIMIAISYIALQIIHLFLNTFKCIPVKM